MRWLMIGVVADVVLAAATVAAVVRTDRRRRAPGNRPTDVSGPLPTEADDALRARQLQALMIHDNVVQGLLTAKLSLELGETETGMVALEETLHAARRIMCELHDGLDAEGLNQTLRRPGAEPVPAFEGG